MMKYETIVVDVEAAAGDVYKTTVVPVTVKSSKSWIWKSLAVIVFVSLCAAASVFFAWHLMKQDKQDKREIEIGIGARTSSHTADHTISTPTEHEVLKQIAEKTKAAIHLHGERKDGKTELQWIGGVDQSFDQGGLKLVDNNIVIPADGLYFVYSQASYSVKCHSDKGHQKFLSHTIWRDSEAMGDKMPLQDSAHSVCQSGEKGKRTYSTVYLGAVFKLMEDDKLFTETTEVADIEDEPAKTFFGVFAL